MDVEAQVRAAESAIDKEPEDLTEQERFAIAILAGCETEMQRKGGSFHIGIKGAVGITKIDGKFHVAQRITQDD